MSLINLHTSGLTTWQDCERLWYYKYGLGYQTMQDNDPITFGNWGHYCLRLVAQGLTYEEALELTLARQRELVSRYDLNHDDELWGDFGDLMQAHELWQERSSNLYVDSKLTYISTEEEFNLDIQGYHVGGQWDGITEHAHFDGLYVVERKFTGKPNQLEQGIQWDWQNRFYAWAAEQIYERPVVGVIYEIVRRCNPYKVKILQNGLPSKAKTELDGTTLEVYLDVLGRAASRQGLDPDKVIVDYKGQLDYLKMNNNPIFRRVLVNIPEQWKTNAAATFFYRAAQIEAAQALGDNLPAKLDRYSCAMRCPFKWVCAAQDDGFGWREVLDATFTKERERFDAA